MGREYALNEAAEMEKFTVYNEGKIPPMPPIIVREKWYRNRNRGSNTLVANEPSKSDRNLVEPLLPTSIKTR